MSAPRATAGSAATEVGAAGASAPEGRPARRILGIDVDSNAVSLLWAAPFMVFLLFPVASAVEMGVGTAHGAAVLGATVAFAAVYVGTWIVNPTAPLSGTLTWRFVAGIGALMVLQGVLLVVFVDAGNPQSAYLFSYIGAAWTLQAPRRLVVPGAIGLVALTLGLSLAVDPVASGTLTSSLSTLLTMAVCALARHSIASERRRTIEHRQALALSRERERTRISSDLHDILGHTLTSITVTADLAGRLIDAGRIAEARERLDALTELSRSALADVRGVVAANRTLSPTDQVEAARTVLDAAGIRLDERILGDPPAGSASALAARAIREATTNAVLHAEPSVVGITMDEGGVEIRNDGYSRRISESTAGTGTGLAGLREHLRPGDRLTAGPRGGEWVVRLELAP